ncbi:BSD-domain-containing protein [Delitschia confertaspora ATCC 74209]|uniref:BSD-domain-containing protein n=1 Tax=Delitschia confertaspora ATCC 74209 TaxID=1513339 RepID=A0A9P4MTU8_9PLEO|nr:BSD-domain-containing protein [Delitschia confertaspora ATCC 74209]
MDAAYDHIVEESYPDHPDSKAAKDGSQQRSSDFNIEIQDAYKAISSSPWAARLGGFLGTVKKQGEQVYDSARKEYTAASVTATTGISSIINRTRAVSIQETNDDNATTPSTTKDKDMTAKPEGEDRSVSPPHPDRPESLPADILKEAEGVLSRFRSEAAKRLKDIERAEDAADEALLKFGSNIRNFLREAVTIAPPTSDESSSGPSKVLFESKDSEGKRVIHTTRFDAQLHVIHSSLDSFLKDPVSPEWEGWRKEFDVEKKTEAIAKDLDAHEELRRAMEKLVPEKVDYTEFWTRYYFLRHVIESEEQRRREMLKASAPLEEEEVAWDEDSDAEEENAVSNPPHPANLEASKETLKPTDNNLKAAQPRRSDDQKSQADSDASYDLVSGAPSRAPSRAPGSPDAKKQVVEEESDEEDWE